MFIVFLILCLNLAVSWWNCYAAGSTWPEGKALGGVPWLLNWCAAIQAAIGFSSVLGAVLLWLGHITGQLEPEVMKGAASLWYVIVILPCIGTGLAITIHSWVIAFRERSIANMGVAAYNTMAQAYNTYGAIRDLGNAWDDVGEIFSSDKDSKGSGLVLLIVLTALAGGILLTKSLITYYAGTRELPARPDARPRRYGDGRLYGGDH